MIFTSHISTGMDRCKIKVESWRLCWNNIHPCPIRFYLDSRYCAVWQVRFESFHTKCIYFIASLTKLLLGGSLDRHNVYIQWAKNLWKSLLLNANELRCHVKCSNVFLYFWMEFLVLLKRLFPFCCVNFFVNEKKMSCTVLGINSVEWWEGSN